MAADILVVDDDPSIIQLLGRILQAEGRLRFATNGADALRLAIASPPDIVLLDAEMPGMTGFQVCAALKESQLSQHVPVIFVTSHSDERFELEGFKLGAADFIAKPIVPAVVRARVQTQIRLKQAADRLRQEAMCDGLTGLANRRRFDETFELELLRARREGSPLSLVIVDIDHFKRYNDHYGHRGGDACLQQVATALAESCRRPGDLVARYGGEEFALLLPQTPLNSAELVAQRVLDTVDALKLAHLKSPLGRVTVSGGVACCYQPSGYTPPAWNSGSASLIAQPYSGSILIDAADRALYEAKRTGRARVCLVEDDAQGPPSSYRTRQSLVPS